MKNEYKVRVAILGVTPDNSILRTDDNNLDDFKITLDDVLNGTYDHIEVSIGAIEQKNIKTNEQLADFFRKHFNSIDRMTITVFGYKIPRES